MILAILLDNGRLVLPEGVLERGALFSEAGRIVALGPRDEIWRDERVKAARLLEEIDVGGKLICPGFIDLHIHGGAGADVMTADPEALAVLAQHCASSGTTGFLATTLTAAPEELERVLNKVALYAAPPSTAGESPEGGIPLASIAPRGAALLGVHLEGPFLNPAFKGAQNGRWLRLPDMAEMQRYLDRYPGLVKLVTLAPELPGAGTLISYLVGRGITVSVGHSGATWAQVVEAVGLGLRHVTHTFNGMSGFHHREPGVAAAALALDELTAEIIADGIHVDPAIIAFLVRVKGPEAVVLITDSIAATGLPDGQYSLGGLEVYVRGKEARLAAGNLAGSTLTMDRALKNVLQWTRLPLWVAIKMASANPARVLGLEKRKGTLEPGKDADVAVLDDDFSVQLTLVQGQVVYRRLN